MTKQERLEKQKNRFLELTEHENRLRDRGIRYIAGMDEVGRGPLAGPVYTACVVLPADFDVLGIDDSKKVSEKKRIELDQVIREQALAYGIGIATAEEIDRYNILEATKLAMKRAASEASEKLAERIPGAEIDLLLIDALTIDDIDIPQQGLVHGDATSLSIAAASIIAKVARDRYMVEMDGLYPGYAFAKNKGYGTAAHYEGIREFGITPIHRRSFLKNLESKHAMTGEGNSMAKKKIYAVRAGRQVGLFQTWDECKLQVTGYPNAEFKGFPTVEEAEAWLNGTEKNMSDDPNTVEAYVDGSYDASTHRYSCGVVILYHGETLTLNQAFDDRDAADLRNVAGEIMGARMAIEWCLEHRAPAVRIYHDYNGIGRWGDGDWKANLPMTQEYKQFVSEARGQLTIAFIKVAAHTGDKYNEMADKLAKDALGLSS